MKSGTCQSRKLKLRFGKDVVVMKEVQSIGDR